MDHYRAAERRVPGRSLAFTFVLAAFLAARSLKLGLDLALGAVAGVMYMRLVLRANERLLDRVASAGAHAASGLLRIGAAGALSVFAGALGPWWGMLVYFVGFFMPYAFFVLDVRRRRVGKAGEFAGAPQS